MTTPVCRRSSRPSPLRRSLPTRSPSEACGESPCGCSRRTAPRGWSGGSSSWRTSRRAAGPTCAGATRCSAPTGSVRSEREGCSRRLTRAAMLAEERRLFYVAVTRPRQRLVVTSVKSPDDDGEQPSRFLAELGHDVQHRIGRPRRPLSIQGLVAELRRTAADLERPQPLREAAAARLRLLATTEVHGRPVAPSADPATWWGLRSPSRSAAAGTARRPSGDPFGECARGPAHLPGPVVPDPRGRRQRRLHGQPGLRQGRPRPRRARRQGRARRNHGRRPDALRRRGVGADGVPDAVVAGARTDSGPGGAGQVPRLAPPAGRPNLRRGRAEAAAPRSPSPTARSSVCTATPTGWSSTSRADVVVVDLKTGKYPPSDKSLPDNAAARSLPARRRPRRRRRAGRPAGHGRRRRAGPAAPRRHAAQGAAAAALATADRGSAAAGRRGGPARGVPRAARGVIATAARSTRSVPPTRPGRCSREGRHPRGARRS